MKAYSPVIGAILVIGIFLFAGFLLVEGDSPIASFFPGELTGGDCKNIYGYFPSFRCCDETLLVDETIHTLYGGLWPFGEPAYWHCPDTATYCKVYIDNEFCGTPYNKWDILRANGNSEWGNCNTWFNLYPNDAIRTTSTVTIKYKYWGLKLCECSLSPCGEPCPKVFGSTQCGFVTNDDIYDENGLIKIDGIFLPGQGFSYTVPKGGCYTYYPDVNRHIIGDTCEECESTQECLSRYPNYYNYLGKAYGAVCDGSNAQLYDCIANGPDICVDWREDANGNNVECREYTASSRCDKFLAVPIECCPGTSSCGPQGFCNPDTWRCETTAECNYDWECGSVVQCDYTTKMLKTPKCQSGQCTFLEEPVDCCIDINCPTEWFCDSDYKCKEKPTVKQPCPFECCENEPYYFDRECPLSEPICCGNNVCAETLEACGGHQPDCESQCQKDAGVFAPFCGFWCWFVGFIMGFIIALIIVAVIAIILAIFIPPLRMIIVSPLGILAIILVAIALSFIFSIPLGAIAGGLI